MFSSNIRRNRRHEFVVLVQIDLRLVEVDVIVIFEDHSQVNLRIISLTREEIQ